LISLPLLLLRGDTFENFSHSSRRTSFLSLRFEPPMMALTAHSHTLFLSFSLDHPGGSRKHGRRRRRRRRRRRTTKEKEAKERQNEEEKEERR
jgi:hypothetical protein